MCTRPQQPWATRSLSPPQSVEGRLGDATYAAAATLGHALSLSPRGPRALSLPHSVEGSLGDATDHSWQRLLWIR